MLVYTCKLISRDTNTQIESKDDFHNARLTGVIIVMAEQRSRGVWEESGGAQRRLEATRVTRPLGVKSGARPTAMAGYIHPEHRTATGPQIRIQYVLGTWKFHGEHKSANGNH